MAKMYVTTPKSRMLQMSVEGAKQIEQTLLALGSSKDLRKEQIRGLKYAAVPFIKAAKERAPYDADPARYRKRGGGGRYHLRDQIQASERTRDRREYDHGSIVANLYVGIVGKNVGVIDEFGTGPRYTKGKAKGKLLRSGRRQKTLDKKYKAGAYRGMRRATPFMRPAWEETQQEVLTRYGQYFGPQVEREARILARKNGN